MSSSSTFVGPSSVSSSSNFVSSAYGSSSSNAGPSSATAATAAATTSAGSSGEPVFLTTVTPDSAYLTPATHEKILSESLSLSTNPAALITFETRRSQACGLITAVSARMGLPMRTTDTAFVVWQKCAVQMGASSGSTGQQVALAAILVACKLNDTLKKAREVIVASFPIRFPDLVKAPPPSSNSSSTTLHHLSLAGISESDVDSQVLESERTKVLSLERTMLESIGYGFRIRQNVEHVGKGVLKLGKAWGASKNFIRTAWQMSSDIHHTPAPLLYPPQVLSLAALLLAALLNIDEESTSSAEKVLKSFGLSDTVANGHQHHMDVDDESPSIPHQAASWIQNGTWELQMRAYSEEIEDVVHLTLDLYLSSASSLAATQRPSRTGSGTTNPSPLSTSPLTPTSPASPSEYNSQSSSRTGAAPTKFSQLPQHVFIPPPLGVSQWLTVRTKGGSGKTKNAEPANAARSAGSSIYTEFSQLLTESKIMLRRVEDERKASAAKDTTDTSASMTTTNGESSSPTQDRRRERNRIDEAKRNVQILRFSVQGDAPGSTEKTETNGSHIDKSADSSSRSNTSSKTSSTTILMNLSEATENVRARVVQEAQEAQQQQQQQVTEEDAVADHSRSLSSDLSSSIQSGGHGTDAPTGTATATTSVSVTPSIPPPAAGVAAAAAVKAGKAVKTTRFLF